MDYGATVSAPTSVPNRPGYAFAGWYLNEEEYEFSTLVTEDITLKAHWTTDYYTVTFETNGGAAMSALTIPYGEKINFVSDPVPCREGYTFKGWKLNDKAFSFDTAVTGNITLVADWTINEYEVSFDLGYEGATSSIATQTVKYGNKVSTVDTPYRKGYVFSNWKIKNGGVFDFVNPITQALELEAVWTQIKMNLTVYFPKNVNDVETIKVDVGGVKKTFSYSEGEEDGEYKKYEAVVSGLDHGTYDITLTTLKGNNVVGGSYSDSVNMKYDITDKEIRVDASNVVDISTSVPGTVQASTISGDAENGYVISGTAKLSCGDGVTILYSNDGNEPSDSYTKDASITVTNKLRLKATPADSTKWSKGSVNSTVTFNTIGATGPGGGTIFYDAKAVKEVKDSSEAVLYKWRFLEAAPNDIGTYAVGPKGTKYSMNRELGGGKYNTSILKDLGTGYAAAKCAAYSVTGYPCNDWALPNLKELVEMLKAQTVIKNIVTNVSYASSSIFDTDWVDVALLQDDGTINSNYSKTRDTSSLVVRPVRCF